MTGEQEAKLRAAFLKVRDKGPSDPTCGVCHNVYNSLRFANTPCPYRIVGKLAATWPELHPESELNEKGEHSYPVAGNRGSFGGLWVGGLWVGEQRRLRISLINHVLDHLDTYQE